MEDILTAYGTLLKEVDEWFGRSRERYPAAIHCGQGCSECCRGLFDITLLDACYLKRGFDRLAQPVRGEVLAKAEACLGGMQESWPEFTAPYLLNYRPEEDWEALMPEDDGTPCLLLDAAGSCLVYAHRPMTCRLNGLPLLDLSGEPFHDDWCTLNFVGEEPLGYQDLRWDFNRHFKDELLLFRRFTEKLLGAPQNELDTFIPTALLIDFDQMQTASPGDIFLRVKR